MKRDMPLSRNGRSAGGRPGEGPRTLAAAKATLRYLHTEGLQPGDRLPHQQDLRRQLGFSNDTLTAAMRMLVQAGVLVRRIRVGTTVADLTRPVRGLWSVGLALPSSRELLEVPFVSQLAQFIHARLREMGHDCRVYSVQESPGDAPVEPEFPGLEADMADGRTDGVLTTFETDAAVFRQAEEAGVPVTHVSWWEAAPSGVVIDQGAMVQTAVVRLNALGCRRVSLVAAGPPGPGHDRFWTGFEAAMARSGMRAHPALYAGEGVQAGYALAEHLLQQPSTALPDGLIVTDDRIAMGLLSVIAERGAWRPMIAVQANRQAPLAFPMPVIRFEIDIEALAVMAVNMMLDRICDPSRPVACQFYCPEWHGAEGLQVAGK